MRTIWHSLAWKEWHEHKWKLVSIAAILCSMVAMAMWNSDREPMTGVHVVLIIGIVPLAIFVGLGTAASERSRGTLSFLQSLPVPMWRVALHKLAFGLIALLVPALFCVGLAFAYYNCAKYLGFDLQSIPGAHHRPLGFGLDNWFVDCALMLILVGVSFFTWTAASGVNRKDEVSAGAVALTAMVGWSILLSLAYFQLVRWHGQVNPGNNLEWLAVVVGLSTAPGGLVTLTDPPNGWQQTLIVGLITAAIWHVALATWYVRRFGTIAEREVRSPQVAVSDASRPNWLAPPRRSMVSAIAWKQFRESGPIVLVGFVGIVVTVAMFFAGNAFNQNVFASRLVEVYGVVSIVVGAVIALVIGIGVCFYDVTPQTNTFWRSRPINPDVWFWSKFLTGLVILLGSIYIPILLIATLSGGLSSLDIQDTTAFLIPTLHTALFASAVAMICLVRHAVYAAILSIAAMYISAFVGGFIWFIAGLMGWVELNRIWWEPSETAVVVGFLFSAVVSTIVAWLAVRYDWGWKSRY